MIYLFCTALLRLWVISVGDFLTQKVIVYIVFVLIHLALALDGSLPLFSFLVLLLLYYIVLLLLLMISI
jgi:hypothetical protein